MFYSPSGGAFWGCVGFIMATVYMVMVRLCSLFILASGPRTLLVQFLETLNIDKHLVLH